MILITGTCSFSLRTAFTNPDIRICFVSCLECRRNAFPVADRRVIVGVWLGVGLGRVWCTSQLGVGSKSYHVIVHYTCQYYPNYLSIKIDRSDKMPYHNNGICIRDIPDYLYLDYFFGISDVQLEQDG